MSQPSPLEVLRIKRTAYQNGCDQNRLRLEQLRAQVAELENTITATSGAVTAIDQIIAELTATPQAPARTEPARSDKP